jgi:hypothetical protein
LLHDGGPASIEAALARCSPIRATTSSCGTSLASTAVSVAAEEMARRLVAATCVLLLRSSFSLRVALCVTGQLRTFDREAVRESQAKRLVGDLRRQASSLDSFLVVSEALSTTTTGWLQALYAPVSIDVAVVRNHNFQYSMHATCGERMRGRERATGEAYAWAIKSRFDLFFYGPLPTLASLSAAAVHSRMRRWPYGNETFDVDALSGEIQSPHGAKESPGCSPDGGEIRVDDQVAFVPAAFIGAYFDDVSSLCYQHLDARSSPSRQVPDHRRCPCCKLTQSLLARDAFLAPLALHFTIVRSERKYNAHEGRGRLEGAWTDVPLDADGAREDPAAGRRRGCSPKHRARSRRGLPRQRRFDPATDGASMRHFRVDPEPDLAGDVSLEGRMIAFNFPTFRGDEIASFAWSEPQRAVGASRRGADGHVMVLASGFPRPKSQCDVDLSVATYGVGWVLLSAARG